MELLKPLKKSVSTLNFKDTDKRSQAVLDGAFGPEENLYTVLIETTCNGLSLEKFTEQLRFQARSFEDLIANKPTFTTEAIRDVSILLEDLFTDGEYTGEQKNKYGISVYEYANKYDEEDYKLYNVVYLSPKTRFYDAILNTLTNLLARMEKTAQLSPITTNPTEVVSNVTKINWKGSNQQLGYLLDELDSSDLITLPTHHDGEGSAIHYPSVAQLVLDHFDLKRIPKSKESLEKPMNPTSNKLTDKNRKAIKDMVEAVYKLQNN